MKQPKGVILLQKVTASGSLGQVAGFLVIALTMIEMFTVPREYFVLGSIVATSSMICISYLLNRNARLFNWRGWHLGLAVGLAIVLYLLFYLGNFAIKNFNFFGMSPSNEQTI